jgi:hypothetical protein
VYHSGAIKIASLKEHYIAGDSYNEDVDVIQMITSEEFIKEHMQETAVSVFE